MEKTGFFCLGYEHSLSKRMLMYAVASIATGRLKFDDSVAHPKAKLRTSLIGVGLPIEAKFLDQGTDTGIGVISVGQIYRHHTRELTALIKGEVDAIFVYSAWGVLIKEQFSAKELINLTTLPDRTLQINNGQPKVLTVSGQLLWDFNERSVLSSCISSNKASGAGFSE
ncbi:hypothetical protein GCM10011450_14570 [Advenella faeciporci]|uniref:Uncharacterized protein n=1 Tax=Advenella faeciporci TaxID=797535 RepID=A0A918JLN0_9BURK|nr:hypothetical protein GCM10011450_14570 [Advenella faeciporci]